MTRTWMLLAFAGLGALTTTQDAHACGGCFAPPGAVQVVTDHRMVLSLSSEESVLWDQLRYTGNPSDFSWILPIRNGPQVRIEVGDNQFLTVLDNLTAPVLNAPPRPVNRACGLGEYEDSDLARGAATNAPAPAQDAGVQVIQESVVGPYMTVTLRGDDPMALRNWLRDNGYSVPAATAPVIDYYVGMSMDFIALKLRPDQGVDRMQPVRITMPGYAPTLPLRMIAAGVADKVGLLLMVIASSRTEAQNFANGELSNDSFTYDFNRPTVPATDFTNAFNALNRQSGNRLWLTESANAVYRDSLTGPLQFRGNGSAIDDLNAAFRHLGSSARITRLRADLASTALTQDLTLAASSTNADRNRFYAYGRVLNTPVVSNDCVVSSANGFTCSSRPGSSGANLALAGVAFGLVALAARRRR